MKRTNNKGEGYMETVLRLAAVEIEVVSVDNKKIRFRYANSRNPNVYRVPLRDILNFEDIDFALFYGRRVVIVLGENKAINYHISSITFSRTIVLPDETKFFLRGEREMITTTLNKILAHKPCGQAPSSGKGWDKLLSYIGKTEPDDEPLPLLTILESNGIADARAAYEEKEYQKQEFINMVTQGHEYMKIEGV